MHPESTQPHNVTLHNILIHVRKECSLWICNVTVEVGFCPYFHVLFNEPGVGLNWFAWGCYGITLCHCSCPHTPYTGTFWFHFLLDLSVSLHKQKDHDSIFHRGGCWGFYLCAVLNQRWRFYCEKCMHMLAYASVWSKVCVGGALLGWGWGGRGSPVRGCSQGNSADVVPRSNKSQRIPNEDTNKLKRPKNV